MGTLDFKLDDVQLKTNLEQFGPQVNKTITLAVDKAGLIGTSSMRKKAPWTDRTTNARTGLHTNTEHSGSGPLGFDEHRIVFSHTVDYGIWLELMQNGKYRVIVPTIIAVGSELMKALSTMLGNIGKEPHLHETLDLPSAPVKTARKDARARAEAAYAASKGKKSSAGITKRTKKS